MRFAYTIIYVADVEQSVAFYEQAFGCTRRFITETKQYAEMQTGATTLSFASNDLAASNLPQGFTPNSPSAPPAGIEIAFVTEDVAAAYAQALRAGAISVKAPERKPWGQMVGYVRDRDGVLVEIGSPVHSA